MSICITARTFASVMQKGAQTFHRCLQSHLNLRHRNIQSHCLHLRPKIVHQNLQQKQNCLHHRSHRQLLRQARYLPNSRRRSQLKVVVVQSSSNTAKYELKYHWLYFSSDKRGLLCKCCELFPSVSSSSKEQKINEAVLLSDHPVRQLNTHRVSSRHNIL